MEVGVRTQAFRVDSIFPRPKEEPMLSKFGALCLFPFPKSHVFSSHQNTSPPFQWTPTPLSTIWIPYTLQQWWVSFSQPTQKEGGSLPRQKLHYMYVIVYVYIGQQRMKEIPFQFYKVGIFQIQAPNGVVFHIHLARKWFKVQVRHGTGPNQLRNT